MAGVLVQSSHADYNSNQNRQTAQQNERPAYDCPRRRWLVEKEHGQNLGDQKESSNVASHQPPEIELEAASINQESVEPERCDSRYHQWPPCKLEAPPDQGVATGFKYCRPN
jgi:hypothetical protein